MQDVPPELSMFATDARGAAPWVAAVVRSAEGAAPGAVLDALRAAAQVVSRGCAHLAVLCSLEGGRDL